MSSTKDLQGRTYVHYKGGRYLLLFPEARTVRARELLPDGAYCLFGAQHSDDDRRLVSVWCASEATGDRIFVVDPKRSDGYSTIYVSLTYGNIRVRPSSEFFGTLEREGRRAQPRFALDDGSSTFPSAESLGDVCREVAESRQKYPGNRKMLAALVEEVGELGTAMLVGVEKNVREEAKQVAATAIRIMEEGDVTHGVDPRAVGAGG